MNSQLIQMASQPKHEVILLKVEYIETWSFALKGENNGIAFEIKERGKSPEEAVSLVYYKWLHLTDRVPELLTALPPPNYGTYTVVSDDDIPF